jgi:hypothetical protein
MRWTQAELEAETPERREILAALISAERIAAMPARLAAFGQMSETDQMRLELRLYPQDPPDE